MATRRINGTTTLVEGGTYNIAQPRSKVRLSRHLSVVGPVKHLTHTVSGGGLVANPPAVVVRGAPVVGSIVTLASTRTQYVNPTDLGENLQNPMVSGRPGSYPVRRYYPNSGEFYVVLAVSSDNKFMRVMPLWVSKNANAKLKRVEGVWTPTQERRTNYDWNTGVHTEVPAFALDAAAILENTYHHLCVTGYTGNSWDAALAKVTSVTAQLDLSEFAPALFDSVKLHARSVASEGMYRRLAQLATAGLPENTARRGTDDVRRHYRKSAINGRNTAAKQIREYLAHARKLWHDDPSGAQGYLANVENVLAGYVSDYEVTFNEVLQKWSAKCGFGTLSKAKSCGHYHTGESVQLRRNQYGDVGVYCPDCGANAVTVIEGEDTEVLCHVSCRSYLWSDGVRRFNCEPGVIGNRHSGKGVVGYVEPLVKQERAAILTLGLELEMQAYNGSNAEGMARAMRVQFESANLLDKKASRKYLHFEEDGSTGPGGFEMVTGYTDIRSHDKLLKALLCKENGKPAWNGKLRSHDASGKCCGIHVHIQAPKTLIHASKIRYFINAADSEQLVRDVARRYNESYAKIERSSGTTLATKAASQMLKDSKGYSQKADKATAKMAMQRINRDRYQAINFQNTATVEFRIFRGSMLHETVMACMEFTQAVYEFCRFTPATGLTVPNFIEFVNQVQQRSSTRNLRTYLGRKGYTVSAPKAKKEVAVAEVGPTTTAAVDLGYPFTVLPAPVAVANLDTSGYINTVEDDYEVTA